MAKNIAIAILLLLLFNYNTQINNSSSKKRWSNSEDTDWPNVVGATAAEEFQSSSALLVRSAPAAKPLCSAEPLADDSHSSATAGGPEANKWDKLT